MASVNTQIKTKDNPYTCNDEQREPVYIKTKKKNGCEKQIEEKVKFEELDKEEMKVEIKEENLSDDELKWSEINDISEEEMSVLAKNRLQPLKNDVVDEAKQDTQQAENNQHPSMIDQEEMQNTTPVNCDIEDSWEVKLFSDDLALTSVDKENIEAKYTNLKTSLEHKLKRMKAVKSSSVDNAESTNSQQSQEPAPSLSMAPLKLSQELRKIKKKKSGAGTDENYTSSWKYFSALKFLVPSLSATSTKSNLAQTEHETEQESTNDKVASDDECAQTMAVPSGDKGPKRKQRKVKNDENDKLFQEAVEIMRKPKDEYEIFGEYVTSELKSLKFDYNKGRLKSEIRKIISRIADEDEGQFWSGSTASPCQPTYSPDIALASTPSPCQSVPSPSPLPCLLTSQSVSYDSAGYASSSSLSTNYTSMNLQNI